MAGAVCPGVPSQGAPGWPGALIWMHTLCPYALDLFNQVGLLVREEKGILSRLEKPRESGGQSWGDGA